MAAKKARENRRIEGHLNALYTKKDVGEHLRRELREYEAEIGDMTAEERKELREWVAGGRSAYDNPYLLYEEGGVVMDYINAARIAEDMADNPDYYQKAFGTVPYLQEDKIPF